MAASVRIEDEAFSDARVELLGSLAGYNRYEALGRLAHLWRLCTQRGTYTVSDALIIATLGERGLDALIGAELGIRSEDGIYVRGTEGRIEWLEKKRAAAKAGGEANRRRMEATREPNGYPSGYPAGAECKPNVSPPAPAPAPALEDLSPPAAPERKPARAPKSNKAQVPADWVPADALGLSASEREQLARFRDHHRSKGNAFADIEAAWRNWKRRAPEFTPFTGAAPKSQKLVAPDDDEPRLDHLLCLGAPA